MGNIQSIGTTNRTEIHLVKSIGFWAASGSACLYIIFDIAAILAVSGLLTSKYWTSILFYAPSLLLALSFVVLMVSIHYYAPAELRIWSHIGSAFAGIYATLNCFIYIIQVMVIAPSLLNGQFASVALFEMAPDKPLYAVNALAYTIMGLSTLFSAFVFKDNGLEKVIKTLFLLHGIAALANVGVLIWQPFLFISAFVGILYPAAAILIAILFYKNNDPNQNAPIQG